MRVKAVSAILFAALAPSAIPAAQGREPNLEELEMEYRLGQASRAFERQGLSMEQMSADFQYRCLRAVGDGALCGCLVVKRPYILRFEQYVGISSRTKAELDYDTLSVSGRKIVDRVFRIRDSCVNR